MGMAGGVGVWLVALDEVEEVLGALGLGVVEELVGRAGFHDLPSAINTTRSATRRAKFISCVMTIIVMPCWAKRTMTSSTSLIISGSRALVGSSKSMALGCMGE